MGRKITDELITTVQSIVGPDYSKMDVVRALHLANNDATAAINIIFDTPSLKRSETPKIPKVTSPNVTAIVTNRVNCVVDDEPSTSRPTEIKVKTRNDIASDLSGSGNSSSSSSKWWFVGCADVAGLSTCKGNKIKAGAEVILRHE